MTILAKHMKIDVTVWSLQLFKWHYVKYANKEGVHRDRNILEQIGIFKK